MRLFAVARFQLLSLALGIMLSSSGEKNGAAALRARATFSPLPYKYTRMELVARDKELSSTSSSSRSSYLSPSSEACTDIQSTNTSKTSSSTALNLSTPTHGCGRVCPEGMVCPMLCFQESA
ncbi:hypothetical protein BX070DRAFT_221197 [Coemansia spiralis]|nr:hypothetical protein BX070DRAFT_221197 [Coemansia spiralis]